MKVGISTACFFGVHDVEDALELLNNSGIPLCEVFLNCESEYDPEFIKILTQVKGKIQVHSVHPHGTSFEPELFSFHHRIKKDAEKTFRRVCNAAYMLGAKYITFHGPFHKVGRALEIVYEEFAERMNELCEIAASYGLHIAMENVNWAFGNKPEFFTKLLPLCPDLKTTLDVKQALLSEIDQPLRFLEAMGNRVATIHLCDIDKYRDGVMPFKGKYNFEKFIKELNRREINAPCILEVYSNCYTSNDELFAVYGKLNDIAQS